MKNGFYRYHIWCFLVLSEPRREKICFCIFKNKGANRAEAVTAQLISTFYCFTDGTRLSKSITSSHFLWLYTALFVSDLVGNPEDRFSHDAAHFINMPMQYAANFMAVYRPCRKPRRQFFSRRDPFFILLHLETCFILRIWCLCKLVSVFIVTILTQ